MIRDFEKMVPVAIGGHPSRRVFVVAGIAGSVAVLAGGAGALAAEKPKVGLVMKSLANEFFKQMQAGAEKYAAKNSDKFDFKAVGMKDERDFAAQVDAIENFVTQKYNIIVVAPANSKAMVTPIAKALKEGVKVINIDVELDQDAKKAAGIDLAFFGPDNRAGAKLAGDALAQELGPGGKVVILEGNPEADNAVQRKKGFMDSVGGGQAAVARQQDRALGDRGSQYAYDELPHPVSRHPGRDGGEQLDGARRRQGARRGRPQRQDPGGRVRQHPGRAAAGQERQDAGDRRTIRRRHGRARHRLRDEGTGWREVHRLGQDADQVDYG